MICVLLLDAATNDVVNVDPEVVFASSVRASRGGDAMVVSGPGC